jgi:alkaline phosphatase
MPPDSVSFPEDSSATAGWRPDRRQFLRGSSLALAGLWAGGLAGCANRVAGPRKTLRVGLLTDLHYADREPGGNRYYRESLAKAREALARLREDRVDFLAVLGDLMDMAPGESPQRTLAHLTEIEAEITALGVPTYHVLGNHDMDNLAKADFLGAVTNTGVARDRSYYAFGHGGVRFVVLDACYRRDGVAYARGRFDWRDTFIPDAQLVWLEAELRAAREPVIVLAHQRLDGEGDLFVKNSPAVRSVLEASGKVLAVFQGHDHAGDLRRVNGIHYLTQRAVVDGSGAENNAYALVEVQANLDITVTGYRRAVSKRLAGG